MNIYTHNPVASFAWNQSPLSFPTTMHTPVPVGFTPEDLTPICNAALQIILALHIQAEQAEANRLPICPLPPLSGSSQQFWATQMLGSHGPDLTQQTAWIENMQARANKLGYGPDNPLFEVIDRDALFRTHLVKPLDDAKLVIADLYQQKYGVRIIPESGKLMTAPEMKAWVEYHLEAANGEAIAIVTRTEEPGKMNHERNYLWHVTPFVMRQSGEQIEVLNLDSLGRVDEQMHAALTLMAAEGKSVELLSLQRKRQADYGSCHTDAMVVAKDVLRAIKNLGTHRSDLSVSGSIFEPFKPLPNPGLETYLKTYVSELPSFLHKTTQNTHALKFDGFDPSAQVMSGKQQSIGEHREKYTRDTEITTSEVTVQDQHKLKPINHYLTFKGFYLAEKVIQQLESLGSEQAVMDYVERLRGNARCGYPA